MLVHAPWLVPALSVWLVTAADADAGAPSDHVRSFALLLFEKGEPDPLLVRGVIDALVQLDAGSPEITLVHGSALEAHLGTDTPSAIAACGADLACVAALGRRAGARQVLYARATARHQGGIGIQFLRIGVETAQVDGKIVVAIDHAADVNKAVTAVAHELWGIEAGEAEQRLAAATSPVAATETPAATSAPAPPTDTAVAPPPTARAEEPEAPAPEHTLPSPPMPTAPVEPRGIRTPSRGPLYMAALLGGVGAAATGAGVYYGRRSRSFGDDVRYGPGRTVPPAALAAEEAGRRDATRATLLFAAGAVLLGSGAALGGYWWTTDGPSVSVAIAGGPMASIDVRW